MNILIIIMLLLLHLGSAGRTQMLINATPLLNSYQKKLNSALIWIIPFVWSMITRSMIKPPKTTVMTKSKRKTRTGKNSDNWEGLTGYGGGSSVAD